MRDHRRLLRRGKNPLNVTTHGVTMKLKFEWDKAKNSRNIRKHGLDFYDAQDLFSGIDPFFVSFEASEDFVEDRWKGIGVLKGVIVVVVVFAERDEGTIRIISLRKANYPERTAYEEEIKNRLGQG
jgi:uncharacterized DUF497 family protein